MNRRLVLGLLVYSQRKSLIAKTYTIAIATTTPPAYGKTSTKEALSAIIIRKPSTIGVIGINRLIACNHSGNKNDGKNAPDKNIIGKEIKLLSGAA